MSILDDEFGKIRASIEERVRSRSTLQRARLQPEDWDDFVGHEDEVALVRSAIAASRRRGDAMSSTLLWGPAGCGKSALAYLIGRDLPAARMVDGGRVDGRRLIGDARRAEGGVLIIDELHEVSGEVKHLLLPVLEKRAVSWMGRRVDVDCGIVATTTHRSELGEPLRTRFELEVFVDRYPEREMVGIVYRMAQRMEVQVDRGAADLLASRARGVPRNAMRILYRMRDRKALAPDASPREIALTALDDLGYGEFGLKREERRYLRTLYSLGAQAGLSNLSAALRMEGGEVQSIEPHLLRLGLVEVSSRGRELTASGLSLMTDNT